MKYNFDKYDDTTRNILNTFVNDFLNIFPNIMSKERLIQLLCTNLKNNIYFSPEISKINYGDYGNSKITIYSNCCGDNVKYTLFHELLHVITHDIEKLGADYWYLAECLVTFCEEKYYEYVNGRKPTRDLNGYILNFANQLNLVFGEKLIEKFLSDPINIHKVFSIPSDCKGLEILGDNDVRKNKAAKLAFNVKLIFLMIKHKRDEIDLCDCVSYFENDICSQLYFKDDGLSNSLEIKRLNALYESQYFPDFHWYLNIIKEQLEKGIINSNNLEDAPELKRLYELSLMSNDQILLLAGETFSDKELNYITLRIFGFEKFLSQNLFNDYVLTIDNFESCYEDLSSQSDLHKKEFYTNVRGYHRIIKSLIDQKDNFVLDDWDNVSFKFGKNEHYGLSKMLTNGRVEKGNSISIINDIMFTNRDPIAICSNGQIELMLVHSSIDDDKDLIYQKMSKENILLRIGDVLSNSGQYIDFMEFLKSIPLNNPFVIANKDDFEEDIKVCLELVDAGEELVYEFYDVDSSGNVYKIEISKIENKYEYSKRQVLLKNMLTPPLKLGSFKTL